jgi:hypothetical protein
MILDPVLRHFYKLKLDKTMKIFIFLIIFVILTLNVTAQDSKIDRISYSLSWTPIYYGPNYRAFRLKDVSPAVFEVNINYQILKRVSISSGIGYFGWHKSSVGWGWWPTYDPTKSVNSQSNTIRIPIQINYQLTKGNLKINPYLKAEIVNEFGFHRSRFYQDDILIDSDSFKTYMTSINIGFGNLFNISKSIMFLTEASLGTYLYDDPFNSFQIKLKLGILIK